MGQIIQAKHQPGDPPPAIALNPDELWTPASLADTLVQAANIQPGMTVLEPSAGRGHIVAAIMRAGAEPYAVEASGAKVDHMQHHGINAVCADFVTWAPIPEGLKFDAVLMHPPPSQAIEHLRYAGMLVKRGGVLAAILPSEFMAEKSGPWHQARMGVYSRDTGALWFPVQEAAFAETGSNPIMGILVTQPFPKG